MTSDTLFQSNLTSLPLLARGKVRDIYRLKNDQLLFITSDRLSAFDVIMSEPIPMKGKVLTALANFWFDKLQHILPNQLTNIDPKTVVTEAEYPQVIGRSLVVKHLAPLPIEAVVRGYISGSAWKDYQNSGRICGIHLPANLQLAEKLAEPIFTPASKAEAGHHDENIDFNQACQLTATKLATILANNHLTAEQLVEQAKQAAIRLYQTAADYALERGIIIADTKFEFGVDEQGALHLIDEALTPDSSRFWPAEHYQVGKQPPSFDKQFVRDYLETLTWNKTAPAPHLPADIIQHTSERYCEAYYRLTGQHI